MMNLSRESLRYGQCRCCLSTGYHPNVINEYIFNGVREVYMDIFLDCFNLFLSTNSQLTNLICTCCINRLRDANSFKAMVVERERQLLSKLNDTETIFINVQTSKNNREESPPSVKSEVDEEIKEEPIEYNDYKQQNDDVYNQNVYDNACDDNGVAIDNDSDTEKTPLDVEDLPLDAVKVIDRFSDLSRLPTRNDLYHLCPGYARHLDRLRDKTVTGEMVRQLLDEPNTKSILTPTLKTVCLSEKLAHITNTFTMITFSNVIVFKSKNKSGFPCFYCKSAFENLKQLRQHQIACDKVSEAKKLITACGTESLVLYAEVSNLRCKICEDQLMNLTELKTHLVNTHKKTMYPEFGDRVIPFKSPVDNLYVCQVCTTKFETFGAIERHMNVHYNNYVCEECGAGFVTQYRLKVHLKGSHQAGKFTCKQCPKVFPSAQKLKNHVDGVHHAQKKHKCRECGERFNEYFKRQRHMVAAHGVAQLHYTCNVCERSFERRYALSRHMKRDHLDERNHRCDQCAYACFTANELRTHMVRHGGNRDYRCHRCGKAYARKKTLTEHMRIHNNERRFVCAVCARAFVQKCSLRGHMRTHHDDADGGELNHPLTDMRLRTSKPHTNIYVEPSKQTTNVTHPFTDIHISKQT